MTRIAHSYHTRKRIILSILTKTELALRARTQVRAGEKDYSKHYEILILSSDIARLLRGSRLTNCMSGKDRTGMSITLEQARILSRHHGLHFYDDASWTRTTMLSCMICGFKLANFPQDGIKKHKGTLYLKIQIHLESGTIVKYVVYHGISLEMNREKYSNINTLRTQIHERASNSFDNDCMAHVQCSV